jgi:hypothetical protein
MSNNGMQRSADTKALIFHQPPAAPADARRYAAAFIVIMVYYFYWLVSQVVDSLLYLWPVTLLLLVFIVATAIYNSPLKTSRFRVEYLLLFSPLLLSLMLLIWGALMAHHGINKAPAWPSGVVGLLSLLHIPAAAFAVRIMKSYRWFAASVLLFEFWVAVFCNLLAAMSVSNVWM